MIYVTVVRAFLLLNNLRQFHDKSDLCIRQARISAAAQKLHNATWRLNFTFIFTGS